MRKWQRRALLHAWRVAVEFCERPHPSNTPNRVYYADTVADSRYPSVTITVYPEAFDLSDADRERWMLHELVHGPASPLGEMAQRAVRRRKAIAQDAEDAEERLVEWVANALWRAYGGR